MKYSTKRVFNIHLAIAYVTKFFIAFCIFLEKKFFPNKTKKIKYLEKEKRYRDEIKMLSLNLEGLSNRNIIKDKT